MEKKTEIEKRIDNMGIADLKNLLKAITESCFIGGKFSDDNENLITAFDLGTLGMDVPAHLKQYDVLTDEQYHLLVVE